MCFVFLIIKIVVNRRDGVQNNTGTQSFWQVFNRIKKLVIFLDYVIKANVKKMLVLIVVKSNRLLNFLLNNTF